MQQLLDDLRCTSGAAALVACRCGARGAEVLLASPQELISEGTPLPADGLCDAGLALVPAQVARQVPISLRLALPQQPQASWCCPVLENHQLLCIWCGEPPPAEAEHDLAEQVRSSGLPELISAYARQQARVATADRLEAVVNSLAQGVVSIDQQRGVAHLNPTAACWLGLAEGEQPVPALAAAMAALERRALNPEAIAELARQLLSDSPEPSTNSLWRFRAAPTHIKVTCTRLQRDGFCGHAWVFDDVSELLAAQQALVEQEQQFRLLAEHTSEIVLLYNPDFTLAWASPSVQSELGYSPEALIGRTTTLAVEEDRDRLFSGLRRAQQDHAREFSLTLRLASHDGRVRWYDLQANLVWNDDDSLRHITSTLHNVDELIQSQQRYQQSAELLKANANGMLDPQTLLEAVRNEAGTIVDYIYRSVNRAACQYWGLPADALLDSRMIQVFPAMAGSSLFALYVAAVESGQTLSVENHLIHNDILGEERYYDIRGSKVGDGLSVSWRDVTERVTTAQRIAESEQRFRLLAENSSDVVMLIRDAHIEWVSPAITPMLGWQPAEWISQGITTFSHPDEQGKILELYQQLSHGATRVTRLRCRDASGSWRWLELHAGPHRDEQGHQNGVTCAFRTVDGEVALEAELDRRARTDELTGLFNRKEVFERLDHLQHQWDRRHGHLAVLFIDVDRFKSINDGHGHSAGDTALRTIAERLQTTIRSGDLAARLGGDEFLAVLQGVHHLDDAVQVAEQIRQAGHQPFHAGEQEICTSLSIGVTLLGEQDSIDAMVARADQAMYEAKLTGRDLVVAIPTPSSRD